MIALAAALSVGLISAFAFVLGDAAIAAAIGGSFSVLNTLMTALLLRWVHGQRGEIKTTYNTAAHAATAAMAAAEGAEEAARVAKSIGKSIRHEDTLAVQRTVPPEKPA